MSDTSPPRLTRRYWLWLIAIGVTALGLGGYITWAGWKRPKPVIAPASSSGDPRITYETPFLNVRPEVQYVGDAKCALCHPDHCESFREHPMGRSLMPVSEMVSRERYDKAAHNPFEAKGFHYVVQPRGKKMIHREDLRDAQGRVLDAIEEEAAYALGSSAAGRSYLINRGGYLYQSPISWYEQKKRWDISPGYEAFKVHWDKPIHAACLFCHCNQANPVPNTNNQFREPIFQGYSIGCERCHGPGQLHAEARERGEISGKIDYTIVNPRHLDPPLREAVCQQCHLQGQVRILARGRDFWDFRPGLPLHLFYGVYVKPHGGAANLKAVGQVEQMYSSKCFRMTKGKWVEEADGSGNKTKRRQDLGCISCHDPHKRPAEKDRISFYRDRCLECHQLHPSPGGRRACSLPFEQRRAEQDSCIACHMPRLTSHDVAHTAITDHRLLRRLQKPKEGLPRDEFWFPGERPLLHFHQELLDPSSPDYLRDLGMAYIRSGREDPSREELAKFGLPLLNDAVRIWPDDLPAQESRAWALVMINKPGEALAAFESLLEKSPRQEAALVGAADICQKLGHQDKAFERWRKLVEINPTSARYHAELGQCWADRRDWPQVVAECAAALQLDLALDQTRRLLITACIKTGDKARARAEFEKLLALQRAIEKAGPSPFEKMGRPGLEETKPDPQAEEKLRQWFEEQLR